jgi:hypothetical protein
MKLFLITRPNKDTTLILVEAFIQRALNPREKASYQTQIVSSIMIFSQMPDLSRIYGFYER